MKIRRAVLGDAHVDRAEANKSDFDADFQRMITEFAWGTVWNNDAIEAQAFGFFAVRSLQGKPLTFPETTGTTRAVTGGAVYQVAGGGQ